MCPGKSEYDLPLSCCKGYATGQAVTGRLLTLEAQVQFLIGSYVICGRQEWWWSRIFSEHFHLPLPVVILTLCHTYISSGPLLVPITLLLKLTELFVMSGSWSCTRNRNWRCKCFVSQRTQDSPLHHRSQRWKGQRVPTSVR